MTKNTEATLVDLGFTTRESRTFTKIGVIRVFEENSVVLENCCLSEFLFIILNGSNRTFTYTRAGHELPILINNKGIAKQLSRGKGQALGVFEKVSLDVKTIELPNDYMMLLYTDGITDAINLQNKMFGLDGILSTLRKTPKSSAYNVCKELIKEVTRHQNNVVQFDDMTILAARAVM